MKMILFISLPVAIRSKNQQLNDVLVNLCYDTMENSSNSLRGTQHVLGENQYSLPYYTKTIHIEILNGMKSLHKTVHQKD